MTSPSGGKHPTGRSSSAPWRGALGLVLAELEGLQPSGSLGNQIFREDIQSKTMGERLGRGCSLSKGGPRLIIAISESGKT